MATRYIYLSDELNNKLKKEDNVSALISQLLISNYNKDSFDNLSIDEIKKLKEELIINSKDKEDAIKKLNTKESEILEFDKAKQQERIKKDKEIKQSIINYISFYCDVNDSEVESLANMYLLEKNNYNSLLDWCNKKNIKLRDL